MTTTTISKEPQNSAIGERAPEPSEAADIRHRFGQLAAKHQSGLRVYISTLGVTNANVDDLAQEALLVAYHQFEKYEPNSSFGAWVRTIARNLVLNDRRKAKRRYEIRNEIVTEFLITADPYQDLAEREEGSRERRALRNCLERLPPNNRKLIVTRYQQQMNSKEIAEELGTQAAAVRKSLQRIRLSLATCIQERLQGGEE